MSKYPEIKCNRIKNIDGKSYQVRKFGLNGIVYEEELHPIPTEKIIRTMKTDGTEDLTKQIIVSVK